MRLRLSKPKLGWFLLLGSLLANVLLLANQIGLNRKDPDKIKELGLIFALDRCNERLAFYSEVKATADAYDKMLENRYAKNATPP